MAEVERHVLALREVLVRFDENMKAHQLMQSVPYIVADRPAIVKAREDQFQMVRHAIEPEAYDDYYKTNVHERPFEEQYVGCTVENAHEKFSRVQYLRQHLADGSYILDVSANDGWMAANLAIAGHVVDCVDLNPECTDRAKERADAIRYKYEGRIRQVWTGDAITTFYPQIPIESYDAVVFFETIEHVPDPVSAVKACARYVKNNGHLYVSTPIGAVEGGNLPTWDHVEPKGHIHAFLPSQFHDIAEAAGEVEEIALGPDGVMMAKILVTR